MGTRILKYLHAANMPVVVVDNRCQADDPRLKGVRSWAIAASIPFWRRRT
jgi:hypothetical protein